MGMRTGCRRRSLRGTRGLSGSPLMGEWIRRWGDFFIVSNEAGTLRLLCRRNVMH